MLSNGGEREKLILQICSCTSCFDNEKKIDEINAENISNIIFQEESIVKDELIVMGFEPTPPKWLVPKNQRLRPLGHNYLLIMARLMIIVCYIKYVSGKIDD